MMGRKDLAQAKWRRRQRKEGREAVMKKMKKLQRLVPGGTRLKKNPDKLFLLTAQHILHLRFQVNVLQALSKTFQP